MRKLRRSVPIFLCLLFLWGYREYIKRSALNEQFHEGSYLQSLGNNRTVSPISGFFTAASAGVERGREKAPCKGAWAHKGYPDSCSYAVAKKDCDSGGLFEYIEIFFCIPGSEKFYVQVLCFLAITLWLAALFYMLGNTAADYFCTCLERLSELLNLSPTVAGATLLPLGNGAPDVFASVVSFVGSEGRGSLGLNSVLGGALFVLTIVAGLLNILVSNGDVRLNKVCFLRDGTFFLVGLGFLLFFLQKGSVSVWEAVAYLGIYFLYAALVTLWEVFQSRLEGTKKAEADEECGEYRQIGTEDRTVTIPPWLWSSQVAMYGQENHKEEDTVVRDDATRSVPRTKSLMKLGRKASRVLIEWPLSIPRRLTIPVVDRSHWSRPRAVVAATLSPILLVSVWSAENGIPFTQDLSVLILGSVLGIVLGVTAYFTTVDERPPRYELIWIAGGFFMSMVWFYVIARELVAALVSLAAIMGIDAAMLGLTVLAWGNSMGDFVANTTLASRGGNDGVQIAMSGCYGGPMFNTLFGLGLSLLLGAARTKSKVYELKNDQMGFLTTLFLAASIVVALVSMLVTGMRPHWLLGASLIGLYAVFMVLGASAIFGLPLL